MSDVTIWFEMSQGKEQKMYTLWRMVQSTIGIREQYIKNLGTDHDESLAIAKAYAGEYELVDDSRKELNDILRGNDVIRFGKHNNKRVCDVPDGYLLFLAKGGTDIKWQDGKDDDGNMYGFRSFCVPELLQSEAIKEAATRGLYAEYEGEMLPVSLINYKKRMDAGWGHFFENGSKQNLNLTLIQSKSFDTQWGTTWIEIFEDENGNKFEYKGSKIPTCQGEILQKGEKYCISATIKHGEYRGKNVTYIQRLKVADKNELTETAA